MFVQYLVSVESCHIKETAARVVKARQSAHCSIENSFDFNSEDRTLLNFDTDSYEADDANEVTKLLEAHPNDAQMTDHMEKEEGSHLPEGSQAMLIIKNDINRLVKQRFSKFSDSLPCYLKDIKMFLPGQIWRIYSPLIIQGDQEPQFNSTRTAVEKPTKLPMIVCSQLCEPIYL